MKRQRPGPEYDVLNAWAGDWIIQGEAKDTEAGSSYLPDGRVRRYRNTWSFGPDGKTLSVKGETERGGVWLTQFEAKGVKRSRARKL